jgi:hypothetical protein
VVLFEKYKKILLRRNPELTNQEIDKILEVLALLAKQTVNNYKKID